MTIQVGCFIPYAVAKQKSTNEHMLDTILSNNKVVLNSSHQHVAGDVCVYEFVNVGSYLHQTITNTKYYDGCVFYNYDHYFVYRQPDGKRISKQVNTKQLYNFMWCEFCNEFRHPTNIPSFGSTIIINSLDNLYNNAIQVLDPLGTNEKIHRLVHDVIYVNNTYQHAYAVQYLAQIFATTEHFCSEEYSKKHAKYFEHYVQHLPTLARDLDPVNLSL